MLARTPASLVYLSAEELGITEQERAGLIEVRDDLASGAIPARQFNMSDTGSLTECGTIGCIGGHVCSRISHVETNRDMMDYVDGNRNTRLAPLYYPVNVSEIWRYAKPKQAVRAIDLFLSGAGPECWSMALADIPFA